MNVQEFIVGYLNCENCEIWVLPKGVKDIELYGSLWTKYSLFNFKGEYFTKDDGLSKDYLKHKLESDKKQLNNALKGSGVDYTLNSILSSEVYRVVPLAERSIGIIIESVNIKL